MYKEAAPDFKALNGTPFLQIFTFYAKANVLMINEIKSCERLQKLLDDNAKLRATPNERKSTADSCSTGCKNGDAHCTGWRRSHRHISTTDQPHSRVARNIAKGYRAHI